MAANLLLLVGTVLLAIAQVLLLCFAGYILARMDILNKQTRKQVNRLNTSIFTPALLFSKVAFSLTASQLKELWIIPILFIIVTSVSAGVAYLLGLICRVKPAHRNFAMAAAMFMNSNSMPIALMQSLIGTVGDLKWTEDDTQGNMLARSLTYLVLYSTLGNIARWSFGVKILERADDGPSESVVKGTNIDIESQPPALSTVNSGELPSHGRSPSVSTTTGGLDRLYGSSRDVPSRFYISEESSRSGESLHGASSNALQPVETRIPLSTKSSSTTLAPYSISTALAGKTDSEPVFVPEPLTPFQRFLHAMKRLWFGFYAFMTMPLWAALASIIIALIPPVQDLISNHMPPLRNALESAGDCSIPLTLVVLGGYFFTPPPKGYVAPPIKDRLRSAIRFRRSKTAGALQEEAHKRPGEKRTIAIAIASRQVLCPAIVLPLMLVFIRFDVPKVFSDPVFVVSNALLVSAPVALTLAQMSTKTGASDSFERLLSTTIFYAYCAVLTPVTIVYIVIGLMFAKF